MFAPMFERRTRPLVLGLCLLYLIAVFAPMAWGQAEPVADEKIIARYKQMLERKPKEGSTFDRLYQFYLEGAGLDQMVADYQAEAQAKPNDPNIQLILGHIHKRLGKDSETVASYQRAVELASGDYYPYAALGGAYAMFRRHEDAIAALTQATELATASKTATLDDLTELYKALGRAYFSRDRGDDAILAWAKIAELDPENIFARIELADLFREQKLYDQAIAQHQAIVEIKEDDPYRVCLSHREIGKLQEEKGDYEASLTSYDAALALTAPGNWLRKDLQHRIVGMYAADGNWEGLIEYYNGKLETRPNDPELIGLLASAHIENQQLDEGIAAYRKGLALAPTDTNLRLNLIAALRNAEKFEEAAAEYETLSEGQPDDFGIYRELGELYLQLEDEARARTAYQEMIDRDPENASTHLILAEIYAGHEWIAEAVAAFEKAISLAPENLDFIEYFGEFYLRQGNRGQAVETWHRMVEGDLGTAANYDRLAKLLSTKHFHTEAIAASRQAVALEPGEYRYREALARLLLQNKEYDEALTQYTEAEKLAPNEFFAEHTADQQIEIYRRQGTLVEKLETLEAAPETFDQQKQLAKMYLKLGNMSYATEILTKAKAFQPNDVRVNRWLAELYAQQGRRDEAVTTYTHLIEIDPENAREYYAEMARAHLHVTDFESAAYAAKQAVAHSPRNPEGYQMLAEIAKQTGNYETAIDNLRQAIRLRPEATDTRAELAVLYSLAGNFRQAVEQYWRCWELSDNVGDKLRFVKSLSEAYYDLGRGSEFEEKLKHKSKAKPADMGPILALAEVYRMAGDLPSARFQLTQALDRERDNPELLGQLVKVSLDLGDMQDALSYQQRLVKAKPDPIHQQRLGELLFDAGREQEAIQAWTKLLHAKNQTLEAEVKLATLLIRHGMLEEALSILDRVGEKVKEAKAVYQVGAALVEMNEYDRAQPHFERLLQMPESPENATKQGRATVSPPSYGPFGINTRKFNLARDLVWRIQQPYQGSRGQSWQPKNFEEAQAGALVQLMTSAQQQRKLDALIQQLETDADANPKDIQNLERLAQIYTLTENTDKVAEITKRLVIASPNDLTYQAIRLDQLMRQTPSYETLKKQLDEMTGLTPQARLWYIARYASNFYRQGRKGDATKLLDEIETVKVTDLNTGSMLVGTLALMGKLEVAEQVIAQLPIPMMPVAHRTVQGAPSLAQQQWWRYSRIYQTLADAYVREGQTEKGVELFWRFFDQTKPNVTNARRTVNLAYAPYSYSGYTPIQSSYPSPTIYYNRDRLQYLQQIFLKLWTKNQLEVLYTKLQNELAAAEGRNRIYSSLALSYCHWWEGKRDKAQEILAALQGELPDDLTLKLNTVFVSVQTGQHDTALNLLDQLAAEDPRNRHQYYHLTLQLAVHNGNTLKVRELITKMLNSPGGARELYQFSQKLHRSGLTQYAIAVAQKAASLAMAQRDPNFLVELSRHLEELGRGVDATRLAARAMRFANQRDRHGQMLYSWNFQQAVNLAGRSQALREREPQLVAAAEKNPNSFQAQIKLATFYESTKQVKKASTAFEAALAIRPKDSMTRQRYAQMFERAGQLADAVDQYILLLKENPNALGYNYWEVIETFFKAGKSDELVSLAKEMSTPTIGRTHLNYFIEEVARECTQRNLPKAAAEIYEKIIEVQPNQYNRYVELAAAYAAAGEQDKAIQFLREKLETESTAISQPAAQVRLVSKLTELYKTSDKIAELVTEYEAKLAEKPEDQLLLYLVASMKIAANDLEGADPLVNQLLNTGTVNANWMNSLADAYRGANDRERERRLLETAAEKLGTQSMWQLPDVYRKLGAVYAQADEKEKAQDVFRKMGTIRILRSAGGHSFWEKQEVANTYMQHEMWDDAETMYTEILNDLSADQYHRHQAQQQLMTLKQRKSGTKSGLGATTQPPEKMEEMNLGMQRTLAQQHTQREEFSKAAELYKQIIAAMPEDLESRAQLANVYSHQKKHDTAIAEWQALLETEPENTKFQDGLVKAYQAADKIDTAIELAQQYIEVDENSIHYIRLAKVYAGEYRVDDAIETYQKAIELSPGNGQVYRELAQLYLRKGALDAAEQAFKDAIQYTGGEWDRRSIQQELMELYRRKGTLEEMLQRAEEEGTLTFEMQQERAKKQRAQGELENAAEAYQKAIDMTTDSWDKNQVAAELIAVYAQLGQTGSAIELYEALAQSSSPWMTSFGGMGIGTGYQLEFGSDEIRRHLINAYQCTGKLDDLFAHLEQRLETDADNPEVLEIIAEIYRIRGDDAKIAEDYQRLCKAEPGNVRSFYYAAAALNKIGQPELAQQMLDEGERARSASNQWNQDRWRQITLADICVNGELYDTAIPLLEAAALNVHYFDDYDRVALNHTLAQAYLGAKRYADAAQAYQRLENSTTEDNVKKIAQEGIRKAYRMGNLSEQLIEKGVQAVAEAPDDPDTHFALGQAYELKDRPDEAIAAYERARALNPDSAVILEPLAKLYADAAPEKAPPLYKQLIKLEDTLNERIRKRRTLINLYKRQGEFNAAIAELLETIRSAPEERERNDALKSLWDIYEAQARATEGITTLEELTAQMTDNPTLYEVLGDAYKEANHPEKAKVAYTQWIELRQKEIERRRRWWQYSSLVSQLLKKQMMPEKVLELTERASQISTYSSRAHIFAEAYIVNKQYEKAVEAFKHALTDRDTANSFRSSDRIWAGLIRAAESVEDTERLAQLVEASVKHIPSNVTGRVYANLALATLHHKHNRPEEAELYIRKSGGVPETAWWIIGPFDKAVSTADRKEHISVDAAQIDPAATYEGKTGQLSWKQMTDKTPDGVVDFAKIFEPEAEKEGGSTPASKLELDTTLAYAWAVVNSPDEREVQIRISTSNPTKIWLNGKSVLTNNHYYALIDHYTAPITLNAGENRVLVKVDGGWGYKFLLWFADTDGEPLKDLTFGK